MVNASASSQDDVGQTLATIQTESGMSLLALVEARSVSPNRIVRIFERGELLSDEPVELSGIIQGQPDRRLSE